MVDTADLKSAAARRTGSSPVWGTNLKRVTYSFLLTMALAFPVKYLLLAKDA